MGPLAWWRRVVRFALGGHPPVTVEDVPAWALCVPWRIWHLPKRPDGRSFEDAYAARHPRVLRPLVPYRWLYLAFLFVFPLVAAARRGGLAAALARPDLALTFPRGTPGERERAWTRPDYVVGMFYAWEYARFRGAHHALDDKRSFAEACARAGLPSPAVVSAAEAIRLGGAWVVKAPLADRGTGVWAAAPEDLAEAEAAGLLVQERLRNDPALGALLPPDAPLTTLRVVTSLASPGGPPRVTRVALRAGRAGRLTDNAAGGGLWAPVDPASGRASPAFARATFLERVDGAPVRHDRHPDTGRAFADLVVPRLAEALALALRAHAALAPEAISLGWDVALTDRGPMLLEVNLWAASYDDLPPDDAFGPTCALVVARVRALLDAAGPHART